VSGSSASGVAPAELLSAADIASALGQHRPTPEQAAVIEAPLSPLLVVAGAGSGKTETMAARVVWLVANGLVAPEGVLGLTFTRKAAGELAERVRLRLAALRRSGLLPAPGAGAAGETADGEGEPTVSTYHSYAAAVVADHGLRLGVEPRARLVGEAAAYQLAAEVVEGWDDLGEVDSAPSTVVEAVLSLAGECAEHLVDPDDLDAHLAALLEHVRGLPGKEYADVRKALAALDARRRVIPLLRRYRERKREAEVLDHGDQVAIAARVAAQVPAVGALERARYGVVLLDEYQDTSHAQLELLRHLFGGGHPVTAVGDPHQSIYGWRGASAGGLEEFPVRFPTAGGAPAPVVALSTSWRNDVAVLDVANRTAAPLRASSRLDVPALAARPGAGSGRVRTAWAQTAAEEAERVADALAACWHADERAAGAGPGSATAAPAPVHRTMAVLCRKRSQFEVLEQALRSRGLPVEVVGLGGLLSRPEVVDLVAALQVVHDPGRGDALLRLLTGARWRIGPRDLRALAEAAGARRPGSRPSAPDAADDARPDARTEPEAAARELVDAASVVDALDDLPPASWTGPSGHGLSPAGRERLAQVARVLRRLRSAAGLPLPELVAEVERALLLDVELASSPATTPAEARTHLDAFAEVAASFAEGADRPSLGGFLAWLATAEHRERGLAPGDEGGEAPPDAPGEGPGVEPSRTAVQLLTVHAAKGLEWDVVAVPGLVEGSFPAGGETSSGWLSGLGSLPYELRGDVAALPVLGWSAAVDHPEAELLRRAFREACGAHELAEERRLAYVAFTRARSLLLLSGAWWGTGKKPRQPSRFLTELVDLLGAGDLPQAPEEADNPARREHRAAAWPADPLGPRRPVVEEAAAAVRAALAERRAPAGEADVRMPQEEPDTAPDPATAGPWEQEVEQLLAERDAARASGPVQVPLPAHLSASRLVQLAADPQALALAVRRPVPVEPRPATRRGTRFHAWLEERFRADALLDLDDLPGAGDETADDGEEVELARLQEAFEASEWAARTPLAVEVDLETPVAGLVLRCRVDAVFGRPDGGVDVVDWKTGQPPSGERARAAGVQLAAYRLAWARWRGLPLEKVGAAFFYATTGRTERPVDLLDEAGLEALVRGVPEV